MITTRIENLDEIVMSEIDVEKAAKRKLVSAALIMVSVQAKLNRKLQLQNALNEWKSY
jgi:hypothetical protein